MMNNEHDCRVCLLFGKTTLMRRVGIILRLVLWYAVVVIVTSEKSELELHPWLNETKRTTEYYSRGHKWPPTFRPNTEGWKLLYGRRFEQIMHLDETHERENKYDGWFVNTLSGLILPNMTENGWGITRAPQELVTELRAAIHQGLQQQGSTTTPRLEHETGVVKGPRSWMIDRPDLLARTIKELQPYAEAWSGTALIPHQAYGFRLYRNDSRLTMHIDKTSTHVISFILHIDSSDDAEPWPLVIEDFQGNTNEVILTSGDMLFYESAKCIHGRPTRFHGTWYSSVFVHYYPVHWQENNDYLVDATYAIPPLWHKNPAFKQTFPKIEISGGAFSEPECPNEWCNLERSSVKWSGPGEEGYVVTTGQKRFPLFDQNSRKLDQEL